MLIEVAGVRVPVGRAAEAARLVCEEYADDALYHHSVRSYFFGAAWAETRGLDFDRELFFVSALLHDLALTPPFDSHTLSFEEAGGHLARVFTAGLGWLGRETRSGGRTDRAPYAGRCRAGSRRGEPTSLQVGTSADVSGAGLEDFDASFRDALVEAYPRLGFAKSFVHLFQGQAERKPGCAAAELVAGGWSDRAMSNPLDQG